MTTHHENNSVLKSLVGKSKTIREVKKFINLAARYDYPIIISGETGVGKTLVAELIHSVSMRKEKPFLHQSCSNISEELCESELFGHEKGAFTGAIVRKKGKIEIADGGTLFLDEISDLSLQNQAKILLFIDRSKFFRVGGTEEIEVDVRIIAASNRDLKKEIRTGKFREDLYFRLNTINIYIPPLRDRREDIPFLVEEILRRENERNKMNKSISSEAINKLLNYDFLGNVRELENIIKKAIVLSDKGFLKKEDIILDHIIGQDENENMSIPEKLFNEMVVNGRGFWELIHKPFLRRELNRDEVRKIIQMGLKDCQTYRKLMELFNAGQTQGEYKRFMKILECQRLKR